MRRIVDPRGRCTPITWASASRTTGCTTSASPVERGRWTGDQMIAVADLAERFAEPGKAQIRLSQKQNLLLVNIPKANVDELSKELAADRPAARGAAVAAATW